MAASTTPITGAIALPKFLVSTDGGSVYVAILELVEPAAPNITQESADTTSTDSTTGFRTKLRSWCDGGNPTLVFNYTEASLTQIKAFLKKSLDFRITWTEPLQVANDPKWEFAGHLSEILHTQAMDDKHTISVGVMISDEPVFTEGTAV